MGKRAALYEVAKNMYVLDERTLEQISDELNVSVATLSRWKQEGNWDELKIRSRADKEHFWDLYHEVRMKLLKRAKAILDSDNIDSQTLWALLAIMRTVKPPAPEVQKQLDEELKKILTPEEIKKAVQDAIKTEYGVEP